MHGGNPELQNLGSQNLDPQNPGPVRSRVESHSGRSLIATGTFSNYFHVTNHELFVIKLRMIVRMDDVNFAQKIFSAEII